MLRLISRIHKVLPKPYVKRYIWLQILFLAAALIQVAGAASLAPFIALLSNPDQIHNNQLIATAYSVLNCDSDKQFLMYFAMAIMSLIVASNLISGATTWLMFHFASRLGAEIQYSTYKSYLFKDYVFYSRNNSSKMIITLTQEVPRYIFMVLQPFLVLCSQGFVGILILAGLLYVDAALSLMVALVVGGGYLLIFRVLRERLARHGENLWIVGNQKIKLITESIGGVKEIRLLGTEDSYARKLNSANKVILRSQALIGLAGDLPRFVVETIAFCALLLLSLYLLAKYGNSAEVISILSLYAVAGYKLLPAAQAVYKSLSQIKANGSALDEFFVDAINGRSIFLTYEEHADSPAFEVGDVILQGVSYRYPQSDSFALSDVNLTIPLHSVVALVGSSGAGKSTLADMVLGMLLPTQGSLLSGETQITESNVKAWQRNLGYVPQNIFIVDDTITANIAFGIPPEKIDMVQVKKAAKMANLSTFIESLPEKYEYQVGERGALLSGGQRQRLGIARALYHDASVLILDEATSALDNITEAEIIATIQSLKSEKTIIMIAHRLSTIQAADMVVLMESGTVVETGTFSELQRDGVKFREMLLPLEPSS